MVFSSRVSWSALVPVALVLGFAGLLVLGQRLGVTPIQRWLRLFGQYFEILSGTLRAHHAAVLIAGSIAKYASSGV